MLVVDDELSVAVVEASVLVVDDEPSVRGVLVAMLVDGGYDVVGEAADGEEAVELAETAAARSSPHGHSHAGDGWTGSRSADPESPTGDANRASLGRRRPNRELRIASAQVCSISSRRAAARARSATRSRTPLRLAQGRRRSHCVSTSTGANPIRGTMSQQSASPRKRGGQGPRSSADREVCDRVLDAGTVVRSPFSSCS